MSKANFANEDEQLDRDEKFNNYLQTKFGTTDLTAIKNLQFSNMNAA